MREFLKTLLLPNERNFFRAKALQPNFFFSYLLILILPFLIFYLLLVAKPGILGVTAIFDPGQIVSWTNQARQQAGASQLLENPKLSQAAQAKAEDMVSRSYWAHFAPDGKSPWDFIRDAGYNFAAAGENLARDFDNLDSMIDAWLASSSHAENLLSSNYSEIGVGTATGVISGKKTTVVVQMFGKPVFAPVAAIQPKPESQPQPSQVRQVLEGTPLRQLSQEGETTSQIPAKQKDFQIQPENVIDVSKLAKYQTFNLFSPAKLTTLALVSFITLLILADFVYLKLGKIARGGAHPLFHLAILVIVLFAIWYSNSGLIL